jgi:ferritin-like metal-binding protein YciE
MQARSVMRSGTKAQATGFSQNSQRIGSMHTADMRKDSPPRAPLHRVAQETLIASLRNAHALEKQVIAVLEPQLAMLTDYPDLHARLTQHAAQSREQAKRLEAALHACGSATSMVKDALLSVMGLTQSSVQGLSSDGVLKAVVADMMTEHLEIATYRTLIALADMAGKPDLRPPLETSLHEEEAMADWFDQNLEQIVRRFVELEAAKQHRSDAADSNRATKHHDASAQTDQPPEPNTRPSDT